MGLGQRKQKIHKMRKVFLKSCRFPHTLNHTKRRAIDFHKRKIYYTNTVFAHRKPMIIHHAKNFLSALLFLKQVHIWRGIKKLCRVGYFIVYKVLTVEGPIKG